MQVFLKSINTADYCYILVFIWKWFIWMITFLLHTCARSILKKRIAVTESTKHQLSFVLVRPIVFGSVVSIESSLVSISWFKFILFCGLFSRSFPIKALTCSRSALEVVFISPNGRANSAIWKLHVVDIYMQYYVITSK